jgi:hypothetical protein
MNRICPAWVASTLSIATLLAACGGGGDEPTAREEAQAGSPAARSVATSVAGDCPNDSKLLNDGPTSIYLDGPGGYWAVILGGLHDAGFSTDAGNDADAIAYLNRIFGTNLATLEELKAYNLQLVDAGFDANRNGFVCVFDLRGRRAYSGDPYFNLTYFGISDDRLKNK